MGGEWEGPPLRLDGLTPFHKVHPQDFPTPLSQLSKNCIREIFWAGLKISEYV